MKDRNCYGLFVFLLWSGFLVLAGAILFLSLQDGIEAKEMMKSFMDLISRYLDKNMVAESGDARQIEYLLRQSGRAGAFLLLGIMGTAAVHFTFRRSNWFVKTLLSISGLLAIAYFTEKVKVYLPTRHFSEKEMLISIVFVILGFFIVSVITLFAWLIKRLFRSN